MGRIFKARPIPPKVLLVAAQVLVLTVAAWFVYMYVTRPADIKDFKSCVAAGNQVLDSYPEQCVHNGQSFVNSSYITNFEECKAAGYPIAESYPEQCHANGQSFINEAQKPQQDPLQ